MSTKYLNGKVKWRVFTDNAIDAYIGDVGEPLIDNRGDTLTVKVGDGVTAGGVAVAGGGGGEVAEGGVGTPIIISPTENTSTSPQPQIEASAFNGLKADLTKDTHVATWWQIATDSQFTNIVHQRDEDTVYLTTLDLSVVGVSLPEGTIYIRCAYIGTADVTSYWSAARMIEVVNTAPVVQQSKLPAPIPVDDDYYYYGFCVDLNAAGTRIAISLTTYDAGTVNAAGAVAIYDLEGGSWVYKQLIIGPYSVNNSLFGYSLAMSDDGSRLVISTRGASGVGHVRIYDHDGTEFVLRSNGEINGPQTGSGFGYYISLSGDGNYLAVGARDHQTKGYVYTYNIAGTGITDQNTLTRTDNDLIDFGAAVSLNGDGTVMAVGDLSYKTPAGGAGAVFIYKRTGGSWDAGTLVQSTDITGGDYFASEVKLTSDGTCMVVGAYQKQYNSNRVGAAYIFKDEGAGFVQTAKLLSSTLTVDGGFGRNCDIRDDGNLVMVGAYSGGPGAGYVFENIDDNWIETEVFTSEDGVAGDLFGRPIRMNGVGSLAIVGASQAGSVYIFGQ